MRRICLWCPIMKRKKIIKWIHGYHNRQMNFDSKNWCEVKFFLWNQSINSLAKWREWICGALSLKEIRLLRESMIVPIDKWTLILKNGRKWSFLMKPKHQFIYPNNKNAFMVPNHEKKVDYYVNLCLPYLMDELWF